MTPEEHNKLLGWGHIIHGALMALLGVLFSAMMVAFFAVIPQQPGEELPAVFFAIFGAFFLVFYLLMGIPSFVAGYGFLKRKKWAKVMGIISAVLAAMSFPIGTAVCVYTFWFLFSDPGKQLYDQEQKWASYQPDWRERLPLNPPNANDWQRETARWRETQQEQYAPPNQPPNWRE
jgi:hypothetical protein